MKVAVIPVYNVEKRIRECPDSTINQTYQDLEFIVINNGRKTKLPKLFHLMENKIVYR